MNGGGGWGGAACQGGAGRPGRRCRKQCRKQGLPFAVRWPLLAGRCSLDKARCPCVPAGHAVHVVLAAWPAVHAGPRGIRECGERVGSVAACRRVVAGGRVGCGCPVTGGGFRVAGGGVARADGLGSERMRLGCVWDTRHRRPGVRVGRRCLTTPNDRTQGGARGGALFDQPLVPLLTNP